MTGKSPACKERSFVLYGSHAEDIRRAPGGAPHANPRGRLDVLPEAGAARDHDGRHHPRRRPVGRRGLLLLSEQGGADPRGRDELPRRTPRSRRADPRRHDLCRRPTCWSRGSWRRSRASRRARLRSAPDRPARMERGAAQRQAARNHEGLLSALPRGPRGRGSGNGRPTGWCMRKPRRRTSPRRSSRWCSASSCSPRSSATSSPRTSPGGSLALGAGSPTVPRKSGSRGGRRKAAYVTLLAAQTIAAFSVIFWMSFPIFQQVVARSGQPQSVPASTDHSCRGRSPGSAGLLLEALSTRRDLGAGAQCVCRAPSPLCGTRQLLFRQRAVLRDLLSSPASTGRAAAARARPGQGRRIHDRAVLAVLLRPRGRTTGTGSRTGSASGHVRRRRSLQPSATPKGPKKNIRNAKAGLREDPSGS